MYGQNYCILKLCLCTARVCVRACEVPHQQLPSWYIGVFVQVVFSLCFAKLRPSRKTRLTNDSYQH